MEKEDVYPASFTGLDYSSLDHHPLQQTSDTSGKDNNNNNNNNGGAVVDHYMLNNHNQHHHQHQHQQHQQQMLSSGFCSTTTSSAAAASLDRLSFADVMQFADFGPKLVLNQTNNKISEDDHHHHETTTTSTTTTGIIDPVYFLKFPVLNNIDKLDNNINQDHHHQSSLIMIPPPPHHHHLPVVADDIYDDEEDEEETFRKYSEEGDDGENMDEAPRAGGGSVQQQQQQQQLEFLGEKIPKNRPGGGTTESKKRKRPRSIKTSEEVESQRMTHIAVERNRRKQMNEHLRVLRSLMPGSYVQRGDQASIIGGAIEFVRELEQLLQCLESQKRRRLTGSTGGGGDSNNNSVGIIIQQQPQQPPFIFPDPPMPMPMPLPNDHQMKLNIIDFDTTGLLVREEETAENKSCLADVEVKLLGFDGIIKILSRRRPGQLIKTIAALEDLQLNILHTNITTIEQTVLYSFNVKVESESQFSAEDIASSVQQIFTFIHANSI